MQTLLISVRKIPAGILMRGRDGFRFRYLPAYRKDASLPAVAVTLPKRNRTYRSAYFFPYFFGVLPEGDGARLQCAHLHCAETDYLARLVATSANGIVGDFSADWRRQ